MTKEYRRLDDSDAIRLCRGEETLGPGDKELLRRKFVELGMLPGGSRLTPVSGSKTSKAKPGRSAYAINIFVLVDAMDLVFPICLQPSDEETVFLWKDRTRVGRDITNHQVLKVYVRKADDDDYFLAYVYEVDRQVDRFISDYYLCDQVRGVGALLSDLARLYPDLALDYRLPGG